ncbi:MAG: hypothetical protein HN580_20310 [Deltaproteobacteria bacterium]|jgi:hypothetical protein|nr:hypothetical protein [Deltaproteobacteria bacterium]MBT4266540.1 hypothetical protein [Deltaproteobacteria bacterium]MBT4643543.1 hypothetical protein [Deltaproteobacteria bacterium]MBT6500915.1 hypothetical protein [Deltaproteobacteria bacterium]MBT6613579.1 hypothetical protein [Deltaproteobacteria bacterium]
MKRRLEIIHLRITGVRPPGLVSLIQKSITDLEGPAEIRIYHHRGVTTDLGIHIHLETSIRDPRFTELGLRLASSLREYGMIEHRIWLEENETE